MIYNFKSNELSYIPEDLPVANRVKNYIKEKEHHSTCTQVLGVIVRASWKEKVSVLNHNEANVMLDALDNLTHHEVSKFVYETGTCKISFL